MNLQKHFLGHYKVGKRDCWSLVKDLFVEEQDIILPDFPYTTTSQKEFKDIVFSNVLLERVIEPERGLIIYYIDKGEHHVGYVLDSKEYIHRTRTGTMISKIKKSQELYKVKEVKND